MGTNREAIVIKIGGSTLDKAYESDDLIIEDLVEPLQKLLDDYDVYVTPGGGPAWDIRKQWEQRYDTSPQEFEFLAKLNLLQNAVELASVFGRIARVCEPRDFKPEDFGAKDKIEDIQICYWVPENLMRRHNQNPIFSDVQTLVMAEELAAVYPRVSVVFAKHTKGIYTYDPNLKRESINKILDNRDVLREKQEKYLKILEKMDEHEDEDAEFKNVRLPKVSTRQFLDGEIIRMGDDGQDDHLIELPAVEFLHNSDQNHKSDQNRKVDRIGIVHYSKIDFIQEMVTGPNRDSPYSFIVRG